MGNFTSFTSLSNQPDADIDIQYAHDTFYFIGIMSKMIEAANMAEDKKQGRSAGVVSQSHLSLSAGREGCMALFFSSGESKYG